MQSSHSLDRIDVAFDETRLADDVGLLLPATLAHHLGLKELVDEHLDLGRKSSHAKVGDKLLSLVMSALAGGDTIDDTNALRAGTTSRVLGFTVKAASTPRDVPAQLPLGPRPPARPGEPRAPGTRLGGGRRSRRGAAHDRSRLDDLRDVWAPEAGGLHHAYTGVRGYHPLLAIAAGSGEVLMARLREGRANTALGASHFLRETIGRVRSAGATGELPVRADSGFYAAEVVRVCRPGARRSISRSTGRGGATSRTSSPVSGRSRSSPEARARHIAGAGAGASLPRTPVPALQRGKFGLRAAAPSGPSAVTTAQVAQSAPFRAESGVRGPVSRRNGGSGLIKARRDPSRLPRCARSR